MTRVNDLTHRKLGCPWILHRVDSVRLPHEEVRPQEAVTSVPRPLRPRLRHDRLLQGLLHDARRAGPRRADPRSPGTDQPDVPLRDIPPEAQGLLRVQLHRGDDGVPADRLRRGPVARLGLPGGVLRLRALAVHAAHVVRPRVARLAHRQRQRRRGEGFVAVVLRRRVRHRGRLPGRAEPQGRDKRSDDVVEGYFQVSNHQSQTLNFFISSFVSLTFLLLYFCHIRI